MRQDEDALSVADAAKQCRVHRRTVLRWIKDGGLKASRYGKRGRWRITDDDLDGFLERHNEAKVNRS